MTKQTLVLAKQDHIEKGNLPQSYMVQVFDALITGKELYLDSKLFTGLVLADETTRVIETKISGLGKLMKDVSSKCKSSKGFMGVELDNAKCEYDVFQNILDEIACTEEILNGSDIEEEIHFDMTEREAKGYVSKMKTFIKNNAAKYLNEEESEEVLNSLK